MTAQPGEGDGRVWVLRGEDSVLVRGAHERTEPLVHRGLPQLLGEGLLNAVQRRAEDVWTQPTRGADAQAQVSVSDEVMLEHEAHGYGVETSELGAVFEGLLAYNTT